MQVMVNTAPEVEVALAPRDVRAEIRRAGNAIHAVRQQGWLAGSVPALLLTCGIGPTLVGFTDGPDLVADALIFALGLCLSLPVAWLAGSCIGLPAGAGCRWGRRRRVRQLLSCLSPSERADALLPLQRESLAETRQLARSLLREVLPAAAEVAPSGPPASSALEVSPPE